MMKNWASRGLASAGVIGLGVFAILGSTFPPINQSTTYVGLSVGTLVKTSGLIDPSPNCNPNPNPPAPNVQSWWNGLPAADQARPFAGYELWRNTDAGCSTSRIDAYRALVTFNTGSVSNLKGLVTKAELLISVASLPPAAGSAATCIAATGGGRRLERFGPNPPALPPVSGAGSLDVLAFADPLPSGNVVFDFPSPWSAGSVPGASTPTTTSPTGTGSVVFDVDVTNQVDAALNGGIAGMSWMITSNLEGPLTTPVSSSDCKTSYQFQLKITHL